MPRPYLSVVIPAFNEASRLPLTLIDVDRHLAAQDFECEIIVALSPSSDNTAEILKRFQSIIKHLKVITLIENQGKGFAIRQGMQAAKGAYRLMMDADNSTSVIEFAKMLPYLHPKEGQAFDVVIGSRYIPGGHIDPQEPFGRRVLGGIGRSLTRGFIVKKIVDPSCGFKVFSAHAADAIFPLCVMNKWAIEAEVLALAQRLGFSVKEVPVYWSYDIGGHIRSTTELLGEHLALWWRLATGRYQLPKKP
jgi:dolichyl-phosphate beta-glucosyltransferase